ncbi:unannotated protein [freshwater metagenome]|uniref:Unannotated protein n=1 Tax=freshwater metagenome TaxID=449393 RepID=A0A6J7KQ19_9ZZZZ
MINDKSMPAEKTARKFDSKTEILRPKMVPAAAAAPRTPSRINHSGACHELRAPETKTEAAISTRTLAEMISH